MVQSMPVPKVTCLLQKKAGESGDLTVHAELGVTVVPGRRIVDLKFLIQQLKSGCMGCKNDLNLCNFV